VSTVEGEGNELGKRLYIKTYGCQMNVYDSARMAELLAPAGYESADSADGADLVILNTCHFREKAVEKVYSELGRVGALKAAAALAGRRLTIAVAGCVAQAEGEEIVRRAPAVDLVVGPQSYHRLPELLARTEREGTVVDTEFPAEDKFDVLKAEKVAEASSGFSGSTLGNIGSTLLGGATGSVVREGAGSVKTAEAAGVWIVGMRYKIIDARTTQQVAQGYAEDKMEVGSTGVAVFGVSSRQAGGTTLDSLVVKLVQKNVADIDQKYK